MNSLGVCAIFEQHFVAVQHGHRALRLRAALEVADVRAGREELRDVADQHRGADRLVPAHLVDGGVQVVHEPAVVAVGWRAVQVDQHDAVVGGREGHLTGCFRSCHARPSAGA